GVAVAGGRGGVPGVCDPASAIAGGADRAVRPRCDHHRGVPGAHRRVPDDPVRRLSGDRGSVTPLVLGFFLIGLLVVAGAVLASDALTRQRDLQSICDGAAVAAANAVDPQAARTEELSDALPLADVEQAVDDYLADDPFR